MPTTTTTSQSFEVELFSSGDNNIFMHLIAMFHSSTPLTYFAFHAKPYDF
jgi:hypothetical protein